MENERLIEEFHAILHHHKEAVERILNNLDYDFYMLRKKLDDEQRKVA